MDIFRTLGSISLSVTPMLNFSGKANTSIHGVGADETATLRIEYVECNLFLPLQENDFVVVNFRQFFYFMFR